MAKVKIYTQNYCPYCVRAKRLLQEKGVEFEEINLEGRDVELQELKNRTGHRTVPQIFINEEFIGGFNELADLEANGQLDRKLS